MPSRPRALVLRAPGTNCDEETAHAWNLAGALAETRRLAEVLARPDSLDAFSLLTFPGGFSFGDDLGAGLVFAARLGHTLDDALRRFLDRGGLLLGICNGFQVLVKAGLLPGGARRATLAPNASGRFEARWSRLGPTPGLTPFLVDDQPIELPVAHGEGRFVISQDGDQAQPQPRAALHFLDPEGSPTDAYPANPNGSSGGVAGLTDASGRIFGLMPHPERHVDPLHHPRWTRRGPQAEGDGLRIFRNAVEAVR